MWALRRCDGAVQGGERGDAVMPGLEESAVSKAICGTKTEESHSGRSQSKENGLVGFLHMLKVQVKQSGSEYFAYE